MDPSSTIRYLIVGALVFGVGLGVMYQQLTVYRWFFWLAMLWTVIAFWDVFMVLQLRLDNPGRDSDPIWIVSSWAWLPLGVGCFFLTRRFVPLRESKKL